MMKLTRCKYCGIMPKVYEDAFGFYVWCKECNIATSHFAREMYAIETWNIINRRIEDFS